MSIKANRPPAERTLLGAIDTQARRTVAQARAEIGPLVARETPRSSGRTAAALRPRVSKTPTGAALTIGAPKGKPHSGNATIADVVRWVNRGTGTLRAGPGPKRRIRSSRRPPRRLVLPGGKKVWSVRGQRANPFLGRIQTLGTPRVQRAFEHGATQAARAIEKAL